MQLHAVEADLFGDLSHLRRGLVDEDAHDLGAPSWQRVDDRTCLGRRHPPE